MITRIIEVITEITITLEIIILEIIEIIILEM